MNRAHLLWRPFELTDLDEATRLRVGGGPSRAVTVVVHDGRWPEQYAELQRRIRGALGSQILDLDHVGSTAVPGLAAKPVIDISLTVSDPADEDSYLPALESAGFDLLVREPDWDGHRVLGAESPSVNLHVWSPGASEPLRHRLFRDWLRTHADDRAAYGALKLALAAHGGFDDVMDYNNQKAALVYDIYERIFAADPAHPHDPRPRWPRPVSRDLSPERPCSPT